MTSYLAGGAFHPVLAFRPLRLSWPGLLSSVAAGEQSSGTVALATMGVACIVKALRCGRVHYYLTGPFFLLMALIALSYGLGILHLSGNGWNLLAHTDPDRSHRPVVSARDVFGKISATKLTGNWLIQSHSTTANILNGSSIDTRRLGRTYSPQRRREMTSLKPTAGPGAQSPAGIL